MTGMNEKTKVLIVEHDGPFMMLLISLLTHFNCDVEACHKGTKALRVAFEQSFDLVILGAGLRDITSFEICSNLRERHISYKTPIIFIFPESTDDELVKNVAVATNSGATDWLHKPIDTSELIYKVIKHTRATAAMQQHAEGTTV
jgi:two-component system sensor histidine kinase ChiS